MLVRRFLVVTSLWVACSSGASAQHSGGSFGGSHFGGGGGSHSSGGGGSHFGGGSHYGGSSHYGGGSDSSGDGDRYRGSAYPSSSGGGDGSAGGFPWVLVLVVFGVIAYGASASNKSDDERRREIVDAAREPSRPTRGDVSAIRIALDHHAREAMQAKLDALARKGASGTKAGRAAALHEICIELRRNKTSWLNAHVENSDARPIGQVESTFKRWGSDARSRYRVETVRSGDGETTTTSDTEVRDVGEGPGLVVVTVVVAARRTIVDIHTPDDAKELDELLVEFGALQADEILGIEVVWSPSSANDRMTELEMGRVYPELRRIRDETVVGRVFCGYCASPFSHALSRCPHCGGPTVDARPRSAPGPA